MNPPVFVSNIPTNLPTPIAIPPPKVINPLIQPPKPFVGNLQMLTPPIISPPPMIMEEEKIEEEGNIKYNSFGPGYRIIGPHIAASPQSGGADTKASSGKPRTIPSRKPTSQLEPLKAKPQPLNATHPSTRNISFDDISKEFNPFNINKQLFKPQFGKNKFFAIYWKALLRFENTGIEIYKIEKNLIYEDRIRLYFLKSFTGEIFNIYENLGKKDGSIIRELVPSIDGRGIAEFRMIENLKEICDFEYKSGVNENFTLIHIGNFVSRFKFMFGENILFKKPISFTTPIGFGIQIIKQKTTVSTQNTENIKKIIIGFWKWNEEVDKSELESFIELKLNDLNLKSTSPNKQFIKSFIFFLFKYLTEMKHGRLIDQKFQTQSGYEYLISDNYISQYEDILKRIFNNLIKKYIEKYTENKFKYAITDNSSLYLPEIMKRSFAYTIDDLKKNIPKFEALFNSSTSTNKTEIFNELGDKIKLIKKKDELRNYKKNISKYNEYYKNIYNGEIDISKINIPLSTESNESIKTITRPPSPRPTTSGLTQVVSRRPSSQSGSRPISPLVLINKEKTDTRIDFKFKEILSKQSGGFNPSSINEFVRDWNQLELKPYNIFLLENKGISSYENMYNLVNIKKENQNGGDLKEKVKNMIGAKQMKYRSRESILDKIYGF